MRKKPQKKFSHVYTIKDDANLRRGFVDDDDDAI
jgi:hypothetical protein